MTIALARRCHSGQTHDLTETELREPPPADDAGADAPPRRSAVGVVLGRTAGWTVVLLGVVLMPLPGPGTLVVVAGLRILVPYHPWAAASYDGLRERAVAAARAGVATPTRVAASIAGVAWVAALTGGYALDLSIPRASVLGVDLGPSLPFHSTWTVIGLAVSTLASAAATGYSIVRLRPGRPGRPATSR